MEEKIKLLYAEDTEEWAQMVKKLLETGNFEVKIARDGNEAAKMFREYEPDMVLLDIDMPGRNGWELVREFKKEKEWVPVVLYSSFYDSRKLNEAFGLGAEDFLSKTCQPEELINRLDAFYKRSVTCRKDAEIFRISDRIVFNAGSGTLIVNENKEVLKRNEACLLHLLCQNINREISKSCLCEGIWGKGMYNDTKCNALKIHISDLRKYLSGDPSVEIRNRRWGGYRLITTQSI